ncbi:VOC family protein [Amycolatopsis sp.]|uniref:VOC family protein n=1 Tax=Amycolatopsis sp. TaxID=37632 RepID=UPI002BA6C83A|nr:VOC family protein [Amycolatopsis sp.]HVV14643.1 VOC family protein [Amycolatopsis sp.]
MTPRAVAEKYFEALNSERHSVVGGPAALAYFPALLANYAAHEDRVTRWIESAAAVTTEIDFTGRLRDGRPVAFSALDVFDLRDGVIAKVTTWYDTHDLRRQLRRPAGLHHSGIGVADLDRATEFYRALGAKPLTAPFTLGAKAAAVSMTTDAAVRVALLAFPDGNGVELFEFGPGVPEWCVPPDPAARLPHLGIRVADVDAALARAEAAGGTRLWGKPGFFGPVRVVYLSDPDGTVLELLDGSLGAIAGVVRDRQRGYRRWTCWTSTSPGCDTLRVGLRFARLVRSFMENELLNGDVVRLDAAARP